MRTPPKRQLKNMVKKIFKGRLKLGVNEFNYFKHVVRDPHHRLMLGYMTHGRYSKVS
jgi:hypothetical protein